MKGQARPRLTQRSFQVNIYGRISVMKKFRYANENKDLLFFLTDKYNVAILEFTADTTENFEVITRSHGCVSDPYARASEAGNLVVVDQPKARVIALRLYDGLLKVGGHSNQRFSSSSLS